MWSVVLIIGAERMEFPIMIITSRHDGQDGSKHVYTAVSGPILLSYTCTRIIIVIPFFLSLNISPCLLFPKDFCKD